LAADFALTMCIVPTIPCASCNLSIRINMASCRMVFCMNCDTHDLSWILRVLSRSMDRITLSVADIS
jgi:hypothetical protein